MKARLRQLYEGDDPADRWFRAMLFAFDAITITYFFFTALVEIEASMLVIDLLVGGVVLTDLLVRFWLARQRLRFLFTLSTIADLVVLVSLLAPLFTGSNLGFLRVLRGLRLLRTFRLAGRPGKIIHGMNINTSVIVAAANLVAFIFVVTSLVWVWERDRNEAIDSYADALYFTISTLTTTGFGDITLSRGVGRFLTIGIMLIGVGFFLNLLQTIYRPTKVEQPCDDCGLTLHDQDATYCKHCGNVIYIETEGET